MRLVNPFKPADAEPEAHVLINVRLHDCTCALDTCGGARGKAAKQGLIGC